MIKNDKVSCDKLLVAYKANNMLVYLRDGFSQFGELQHCDRYCRSDFLSYPVTVYEHLDNQSQHRPYDARRLAAQPPGYQFFKSLYDSTWKKIHGKIENRTQVCRSCSGSLTTGPWRFHLDVSPSALTVVFGPTTELKWFLFTFAGFHPKVMKTILKTLS